MSRIVKMTLTIEDFGGGTREVVSPMGEGWEVDMIQWAGDERIPGGFDGRTLDGREAMILTASKNMNRPTIEQLIAAIRRDSK